MIPRASLRMLSVRVVLADAGAGNFPDHPDCVFRALRHGHDHGVPRRIGLGAREFCFDFRREASRTVPGALVDKKLYRPTCHYAVLQGRVAATASFSPAAVTVFYRDPKGY